MRTTPVTDPPRLTCRLCGSGQLFDAGQVDSFAFVECATCAFVFAPAITRDSAEALYQSGYHGPTDGAPAQGWADPSFLDPAFALLGNGGPWRILDFGAGQSVLPTLLRDQGHRVIAVDTVPPTEPHPDRLTGDLLDLHLDAGQFDLAFAFQVFEHLPEPRPFLEELLRLTRPGGLVLIHTDMHTPEREQGFTQWWYATPPDHCAFFRHHSFEVLVEGSPHEIAWRDEKCVILRAGVPAECRTRSAGLRPRALPPDACSNRRVRPLRAHAAQGLQPA